MGTLHDTGMRAGELHSLRLRHIRIGGMIKTYQSNGKELVGIGPNDSGGAIEVRNKTGKTI